MFIYWNSEGYCCPLIMFGCHCVKDRESKWPFWLLGMFWLIPQILLKFALDKWTKPHLVMTNIYRSKEMQTLLLTHLITSQLVQIWISDVFACWENSSASPRVFYKNEKESYLNRRWICFILWKRFPFPSFSHWLPKC